jgi:hypothetical protein
MCAELKLVEANQPICLFLISMPILGMDETVAGEEKPGCQGISRNRKVQAINQ